MRFSADWSVVSAPYSSLYAAFSSAPNCDEWPPGTYCAIQSYRVILSNIWPVGVELFHSVG